MLSLLLIIKMGACEFKPISGEDLTELNNDASYTPIVSQDPTNNTEEEKRWKNIAIASRLRRVPLAYHQSEH
jgi:hypothetical protein